MILRYCLSWNLKRHPAFRSDLSMDYGYTMILHPSQNVVGSIISLHSILGSGHSVHPYSSGAFTATSVVCSPAPADENPVIDNNIQPGDPLNAAPIADVIADAQVIDQTLDDNDVTIPNGQNDDHQNSMIDNHDNSSLIESSRIDNVDMFILPKDLQDELSKYFDNKVLIDNKYKFPDNQYSHFKIPSLGREVAQYKHLLKYFGFAGKDLMNLYIKALFKLYKYIRPIKGMYLVQLHNALMHSGTIQSMPAYFMAPNMRNALAYSIYGLAHGCQDLLIFRHSLYSGMKYEFKYNMGDDETSPVQQRDHSSKTVILENVTTITLMVGDAVHKEIKYEGRLGSFDIASLSSYKQLDVRRSIYNDDVIRRIYSVLLDINSTIKIGFFQSTTTERRGFVLKSVTETFYDGFNFQLTSNGDVEFSFTDKAIIDMLIAWLFENELPELSELSNRNDVISYINTMIYAFILDNLVNKINVRIKEIDLVITINRRVNDEIKLHDIYIDEINKGNIVPLSALQYAFYFDMDVLNNGNKFMVLSSFVNFGANTELKSVMPIIDNDDKRYFRQYAKYREYLKSSNYISTKVMYGQRSEDFYVTFEDFVKQMAVRALIGETPQEYFPLISLGRWKGTTGDSIKVSPAASNRYYTVFALENYHYVMKTLVDDLLMQSSDSAVPYYVKSRTRLLEHAPRVFDRFVPNSLCNDDGSVYDAEISAFNNNSDDETSYIDDSPHRTHNKEGNTHDAFKE